MVVAKTIDGDLGILASHPPVLGILAEGSLIRILDPDIGEDGQPPGDDRELRAAISGGFLSVADDRVSILAHQAQMAGEVDAPAARAELEAAAEDTSASGGEPAGAKYARARLRAAGEQA
jgi:F-type H+-transporting ATPase subunit epsilon